jgi:sulfoxide reductase heme-binding subunit YedZ
MNPQVWWYVARASGIIAWLLLTASVIWGVLLSTDAFAHRRRPAWLLDLHRWLGGLTVGFVVAHLAALVADSYIHIDLADLAIPYATNWRPGAIALGIVSTWTLLAVELTSLAMRRLPRKLWRAVHLSSYLVFWMASLHAAFAGSDTTSPLYQLTAAISVAAVVWTVVYRLTSRRDRQRRRRLDDSPPPIVPAEGNLDVLRRQVVNDEVECPTTRAREQRIRCRDRAS